MLFSSHVWYQKGWQLIPKLVGRFTVLFSSIKMEWWSQNNLSWGARTINPSPLYPRICPFYTIFNLYIIHYLYIYYYIYIYTYIIIIIIIIYCYFYYIKCIYIYISPLYPHICCFYPHSSWDLIFTPLRNRRPRPHLCRSCQCPGPSVVHPGHWRWLDAGDSKGAGLGRLDHGGHGAFHGDFL